MKSFIAFTILLLLLSCSKKEATKPLWINGNKVSYSTTDTFIFITNEKNWTASLFSFVQPLPTILNASNDTIFVQLNAAKGVLNGKAQLCLQQGNSTFNYSFYLQNKVDSTSILKDYRSPKTVNPDSSLLQHRIIHHIDSNRNIIKVKNNDYFFENSVTFSPKVKTYRAIENEPLTAHYVQAGSATAIPIQAKYNEPVQQYEIQVGIIYDAHKNIISDGTNVAFEYSNTQSKGIANATTLNGIAKVILPISKNIGYSIVAKINKIKSKPLKL
jgi:hypothetical protein